MGLGIALVGVQEVFPDNSSPAPASEIIRQAEQDFAAGNFEAARSAYQSAAEILGITPEINYNLGLTHYKLGDFEQARKYFQDSLATRDTTLESQAKYNLGNTAYGEALSTIQPGDQTAAPPDAGKAQELLNQAIHHYGDALALNPDDEDARANIELAQRMIEQLKQMQQQQQQQNQQQDKQQQDQQQNQDQQQQQQQNQPSNEQQENQPQDQQQEDEQQQDQSQESQQTQESQDQESGEESQQDQAPQPEEAEEQPEESKADQKDRKDISEQEAERILQSVRDKERKRNEAKAKAQRAKRVPVARDW